MQTCHGVMSTILMKHPEYYDEISTHMSGSFPKPKS
jgi:hypothetical protein